MSLAQSYTFDDSDTFAGPATVEATDRAGNLGTADFTVSPDESAPDLTLTVPDFVPIQFEVTWEATDPDLSSGQPGSGVRDVTVEYREGANGAWQSWLTETIETESEFVGTPGQQYFFRAKATDNVSNENDWVQVGPIEVKAVTKYYTFSGQRVAMRRGDEVYYLHGDHLGSTSLTTDSAGTVVSEVRYHPYGLERWVNGESVTDFGFTSQRNERGFGLSDYNARYYNPTIGRFVSPDTIVPDPSNGRGFNRYRYVRNNPLKYTDPTGHQECAIHIACYDVEVGGGGTIETSGGGAGGIEIALLLTVLLFETTVEVGDYS